MKRLIIVIISILLVSTFTIGVFANESESMSWYIKRNGNKRPALDEKQKIIYQNNGYYIDESLNDNSKERRIYLTFDLGYANGNTEKIIDVLKKHNVKAAFFILDNIIIKNTDLVTRMINEGHTVCNHSKNHKNLSDKSKEEIKEDLEALEALMEERTGYQLSKYFRFPEGKYSQSSLKAVSDLGYKTIFWSFAYEDWDNNHQPSPEKAFNKIISNTHNGAVMLFHPTSATNAKIFDSLLTKWKEMGYTFSSLDELSK